MRSDVADFELDEMEAAAAGKAAKTTKKKKNRKRRRMSRKNDGLDALRGIGGVSDEPGLLEASTTTTTTTAAVSPYGDVSNTAMMGGDNPNSLGEASDESGKDFKEHL